MRRAASWVIGAVAALVVVGGLVAVVAAGFVLSFDAMRSVGEASRIKADLAWLLPVSVDGSMSVATVCVAVLSKAGQRRNLVYAWVVVLTGATISVLCNGVHSLSHGDTLALPGSIRFAVSAIPAVMLALTVHLGTILVEATKEMLSVGREDEAPPAPESDPVRAAEPVVATAQSGTPAVASAPAREPVKAAPAVVEASGPTMSVEAAARMLADDGCTFPVGWYREYMARFGGSRSWWTNARKLAETKPPLRRVQ